MTHRVFSDPRGTQWEAWDVHPQLLDRWQLGVDRAPQPDASAPKFVRQAFRDGWLCFQSAAEKRRIAPVPADWAELSDEALARLCDGATLTALPSHRLIE